MKKIILIGKYDANFQNINDYLSLNYSVQTCADKLVIVQSALIATTPDLIVMRLFGMDEDGKKICEELSKNYSSIPVVCIGTFREHEEYGEFLKSQQFHSLLRPIDNEQFRKLINTLLDKKQAEDNKSEAPAKKKVLLVDDNAIQLRLLNGLLKDTYDVQMATSGAKAISAICKKRPDIIFLDYDMPICDGKMTLEMIRDVEEAGDIPVVFLTGVSDKAHIEAVLALKPAGYMLKPAKADKIFETIERLLGE